MTRPSWALPWTDLLLAAVFVTLVSLEPLTGQAVLAPAQHLAFAVPAMGLLALRSRLPIVVALLVLGANFAVNSEGSSTTILAVPFAVYSVGAISDPRRSVAGLLLLSAEFLVPYLFGTERLIPSDLAALMAFIGGPWLFGAVTRRREETTREAIARADQLERERHLQGELAAARERVRLARELHDVVSHSISVVAVQTQAVRRRLRPDQQREADDLHAVETTAREAMAELRRLFGVLRSDEGGVSLAPQPGLAELDRLLDQVRGTGLEVRLERVGDTDQLQPGVDLAAYRIVQEALTNVIKHAEARQAVVRVEQRPDGVDLSIEDDGRGISTRPHGHVGGGHGLDGIRERAELYGGTLDVGASAAGGVRVRARLPLSGVPA